MTNILQSRAGDTQGIRCALDVVGAQRGIMSPAGKKRGKNALNYLVRFLLENILVEQYLLSVILKVCRACGFPLRGSVLLPMAVAVTSGF